MIEYPYSWKPSSNVSLDEFLQKYKPSMVVDDGTKPWIWVRRVEHEPLDAVEPKDSDDEGSVIEKARKTLDDYTEKINAVQKDDGIPVRSNKKKGLRSKKEVREEIMAEATNKFKEISEESKLTCGKWLFFASTEHIDALFARLALDLVAGELSKTSAFCAKVATTPLDVGPSHRYLVCLYLPNLYDKDAAAEVLRTICQSIGVRPNSAKTDLYTMIGIDSKHPSGIKSTIWNPTDLIPEPELKTLVDTYWAEAKKKAAPTSLAANNTTDNPDKKHPKFKRKADDVDDDNIFDDIDKPVSKQNASNAEKVEKNSISKAIKTSTSGPTTQSALDDSATESESDDPPVPPSTTKSSSLATKPLTPQMQAEDSSSDEDAPKKPKKVRRF